MKNIYILLASILLISCEDIVTEDIILNEPNIRMVVEGGIHKVRGEEAAVQHVFVSQSLNVFEADERVPVTDAIVSIQGPDGSTFDLIQNPDSLGLYESEPISVSTSKVYSLTVIWKGEEYYAEETVRSVPPIENIFATYEEKTDFQDEGYRVNIDFTDTSGESNFYFWQVFVEGINGIVPDPGNDDNLIQSDEFFDGNTIRGYQPNEDALPEPGEEVEVRQLGISKNYFDFLRTLLLQTSTNDGIFDTPPVPIRGNVVNRTNPDNFALGYFTASEVSIARIVIEE